jgi:hypothetical protein
MPATVPIPTQSVVPGQLISAVLWNGEFQNIFNNFIPASFDDASSTAAQMQSMVNPFPGSVLSLATTLLGELERLRWAVAEIKDFPGPLGAYWYQPPTLSMAAQLALLKSHTHADANTGGQLGTAAYQDASVTDAKIVALDAAKLTGSIPAARYAAATVPLSALAADAKFAAGTRMIFCQSAVPTGWALVTTFNDKGLRVVSSAGSGGVAGGNTGAVPFSSGITLQHFHTVASHHHNIGNHYHNEVGVVSYDVASGLFRSASNPADLPYGYDEIGSDISNGTTWANNTRANAFLKSGGTWYAPRTSTPKGTSFAEAPQTDVRVADFAGYQYVNVLVCEKS